MTAAKKWGLTSALSAKQLEKINNGGNAKTPEVPNIV